MVALIIAKKSMQPGGEKLMAKGANRQKKEPRKPKSDKPKVKKAKVKQPKAKKLRLAAQANSNK